MISMIVGASWAKLTLCSYRVHAAPCRCGTFHVNLHENYMHLHCSNFSQDTATFTKPEDFKVELLPLVARNRKIWLDLVKSQKLIPAKSTESQNRKILYSQIIVRIRWSWYITLHHSTRECMYTHARAHTHARTYAHTHTHTHTHTHARTHARTHAHTHACVHTHNFDNETWRCGQAESHMIGCVTSKWYGERLFSSWNSWREWEWGRGGGILSTKGGKNSVSPTAWLWTRCTQKNLPFMLLSHQLKRERLFSGIRQLPWKLDNLLN